MLSYAVRVLHKPVGCAVHWDAGIVMVTLNKISWERTNQIPASHWPMASHWLVQYSSDRKY